MVVAVVEDKEQLVLDAQGGPHGGSAWLMSQGACEVDETVDQGRDFLLHAKTSQIQTKVQMITLLIPWLN